MLRVLLLVLACFSLGAERLLADEAETGLPLAVGAEVRFAGRDEAAKLLGKRDRFVDAQSGWDRQARLKTDRDVPVEEFLKFAAGEALDWEAAERKAITATIEKARERLRAWKLPWPKEILLVHTTGKEEGGAACCRQNAVVLPKKAIAGRSAESLERLLLHELFHILSSHNEKLRERLYGVIGFSKCGAIALPAELAARKITNPDAPTIEHVVEVTVDDKPVHVVPILLAEPAKYDAASGKEFFAYMQFRLLAVAKGENDRYGLRLVEGKPWLVDPAKTPSYHEKIGRNTGYIIHPEEVMADNFVLLVVGEADVKTPRILEEMRAIFRSPESGK